MWRKLEAEPQQSLGFHFHSKLSYFRSYVMLGFLLRRNLGMGGGGSPFPAQFFLPALVRNNYGYFIDQRCFKKIHFGF